MRVDVGSASIVLCLAIATAGVIANVHQNGFPFLGSMELQWVGEKRAPFLMAASIFGSQSFVSLVLMYILKHMRELNDCWGSSFQNTLNLYAWMSLVGAVMYISKYCSSSHIIVDLHGVGEYLFMRNLHWMVSTPTQWFVFSQVCTRASPAEMAPIYMSTLLTHVFGMYMYFVGEARMRWFCFWASTYYFLHSFYLAFKLKLHKDMAVVGARLRLATLIVWSGFPTVVALRWMGYIGPWGEQVLMMSVLDVVTKSITFSAIIVSRVVLSLARINGTVQLVLSSHDVTLALNDTWQLLDNETSSGLVATYFGKQHENTTLLELCINQEHQERLIQAARTADSQSLGAPTPKVVVAFRMPGGGGEMLAECLVSKCLHGRRIIGIAVASQAGNAVNFGGQDHEPMDEWNEQAPSEISVSSTQSRSVDVQMKLALHNCNDVLQLPDPMRRMMNAIFMQSHTACALFAWEEEGLTPAIVVASPRLQALLLQTKQMPQPLTTLFNGDMVERFLLAVQAEDVIMHQWRNVQSPSGIPMEVTMLPLSGMSSMGSSACACSVELCILVLILMDSQAAESDSAREGQQPGYLQWQPVGCELVCDAVTDGKARQENPPRLLMPLAMAYLESLR